MTVLDNVRLAFHHTVKYGIISSLFRFPAFFKEEKRVYNKALELLEIFNLSNKKDELAKNLPYGEQRRLEIARALAANPKVLLLDEPAAGMNPNETMELIKLITWVRDKFKLTVILIEHDMSLVMSLCDRIFVLDYGTLIAEGTPDEVQNNQRVIEAYLGGEKAC
jgi:branched-chain amino acid transport system ATP-binding protein